MCGGHIHLSRQAFREETRLTRQTDPPPPTDPRQQSKHGANAAGQTLRDGGSRNSARGATKHWLSDAQTFLNSRDTLRVLVGSAVLLAVALALRLAGFFSPEGTEQPTLQRMTNVPIPDTVSQEPVIAREVGGKLLNGAFIVFKQFHAAKTPEEKLRWVMRPEAVRERLLQYYAERADDPRDSVSGFTAPERIAVDDIRRGIVALVRYKNAAAASPSKRELEEIAFFKQTPEGMRLDWESYIQAKDGLLREFLADDTRGSGIFRVRLTRCHYFGPGTEPANCVTVQLDDLVPLQEQPYLFIPGNSTLAAEIERKLVWSENPLDTTRYATARLGWKPSLQEPGSRKLILNELICWELLGVGCDPGAQ